MKKWLSKRTLSAFRMHTPSNVSPYYMRHVRWVDNEKCRAYRDYIMLRAIPKATPLKTSLDVQ